MLLVALDTDSQPNAHLTPPLNVVRYFGDYELLGEIAHGGMGIVYRARQVSLNRIVALKMIRAGQFATDDEVRRFRTEAEAVANLDHPNIVPIYEVGEHDGRHYFSMRFIDGGSLTRQPGHVRDQRASARLLGTIAHALHHAHQRGILHRDLKPANVLLDPHGEPHIADFGLARQVDGSEDLTRTGVVLGTPCYMAPECARGGARQASIAGDVYSLGSLLYEELTGRPPFIGDTVLAVLRQVAEVDPPPLRHFDPRIDGDLEVICLKCLEKEPGRRYASAQLLARDLERWLAGEPVQARSTSLPERALKWTKRRPAIAILGTALLIALAIGIGGVLFQWWRAEHALALAEGRLYFNTIALADRDRLMNRPRAQRILDESPSQARGWEWDYLNRQLSSDRAWQTPTFVGTLALSRDGTRVFTTEGTALRVWDSASGRDLQTLYAPAGRIMALAVSPDGASISVGNWTAVTVFDLGSGAMPLTLKDLPALVLATAWTPDGRRLASGCADGVVRIWDSKSGRQITALGPVPGAVTALAFSPDGLTLATSSVLPSNATPPAGFLRSPNVADGWLEPPLQRMELSGQVTLWNLATSRAFRVRRGIGLVQRHVSFSPDGRRIAIGATVWDKDLAHRLFAPPVGSAVISSAALSFDGRRMAAAIGGVVYGWDVNSGNELFRLYGHSNIVLSMGWSSDGKSLASGDADGLLRVSQVAASAGPAPDCDIGARGPAIALAFNPDRQLLAVATDEPSPTTRLTICDLRSGATRSLHVPEIIYSLAFSMDGALLASAGTGRLRLWDALSGKEMRDLGEQRGPVFALAFSNDRRWLAAAVSLEYTGGGPSRGDIVVLDALTGEAIAQHRDLPITMTGLTFSPDGSLIAAGVPGGLRSFGVLSGIEAMALGGHETLVSGVAFTLDGRRLVTAAPVSPDTRTVERLAVATPLLRIWEAQTGREVMAFREESDYRTPTYVRVETNRWASRSAHGITLPLARVGVSADGYRLTLARQGWDRLGSRIEVTEWDGSPARALQR